MGKEQDLLDACRSGQLAIVEKILNARIRKSGPLTLTSLRRLPGPNTSDPRNGFTCLHYASLNGHKDIVRILLEHDANPNIVDHNGSSPLHLASWTGDYEVVDLLITNSNQRADINLKNKDNETALHSACQYGHTAVVSLLLTQGGDPFVRNIRLETPLDLSAQYGRLDTIELLLRMRFDLLNEYIPGRSNGGSSFGPHSPLHLASRNGHKAVVKMLLELGFDVDYLTQNGTALHEAVLCGKVEVVKILLDSGCDIELVNDKNQKVEELLNGLNTSVAKQTLKLIQDHVVTMAGNHGGISPLSESTTIAASGSFCDQEDLTIVDSMLNDDIVMFNHDYNDLIDETEVHCISPPPGYTDNTPDHVPNATLDIECVSPSSSLFSQSIFSELASIFDEHLNRNSADERTSQEFTEEFLRIKPSTSFNLNDYRSGAQSAERYTHHQSFDAVYLQTNANTINNDVDPMMSTSLNMKMHENDFGDLRRATQDTNRDSIISSNYSISSVASSSVQSSTSYNPNEAHRYRPPKPPRKSIELSKAKSMECTKGLLFDQMSSKPADDNKRPVLVNGGEHEQNDSCADVLDSDHSTSQQMSSVISNDVKGKRKTSRREDKSKSSSKNGPNRNSVTLAQSIEDFYLLYDEVARGGGRQSKSPEANVMMLAKKHSSVDMLISDDYDQPKCVEEQQLPNCPSPLQAGELLFCIIEPFKQKYDFDQNSETVTRLIQPNLCQKHHNLTNGKCDSWTLTEDSGVVEDIRPNPNLNNSNSNVEKRSVGVSAQFLNGTPQKRKSLRKKRSTEQQTKKAIIDERGPETEMCNGKKDYFSAYCETLKFDKKGDKENPFAGLCRGGLTPAKTVTNSQSKVPNGTKQKKKTVELSEARKSLRRQRNILSGRAESLSKLSKLSVYNDTAISIDGSVANSPVPHSNNIYATLRKNKKKSKSLNGDTIVTSIAGGGGKDTGNEASITTATTTTTTTTTTNESSQDSENKVQSTLKVKFKSPKKIVTRSSSADATSAVKDQQALLEQWLADLILPQYKNLLISNGYDNLKFMDSEVMDDSDLLEIGIVNANHREKLIKSIKQMNHSCPKLTKKDLSNLSVSEWLTMLQLQHYTDIFHKNGIDDLRKIRNIWEVELETMLEIEKMGHRKRIMYSLSDFNRESILLDDEFQDIHTWLNEQVNQNTIVENKKKKPDDSSWNGWKHARHELVSGSCQYIVCYLGSTLVRELRGIDSTRASIGKLKNSNMPTIPKIILAISCKGVQFKNSTSNKLICEHEIRNIHCICQDSDDLNYFAYITKDFETNNHYCHVFMSQQTELVTEIILTLGQAFEIAYQIVLEQYNMVQANVQANSGRISEMSFVSSGIEPSEPDVSVYSTYVKNNATVLLNNSLVNCDKVAPEKDELKVSPLVNKQNNADTSADGAEKENKPNNIVHSEDIYAVVDKSRKLKARQAVSEDSCIDGAKMQSIKMDQRPVPPVRSSSTNSNSSTQSTGNCRPEIKPKPPLRVASMRKPEISPKPKNLQPKPLVGGSCAGTAAKVPTSTPRLTQMANSTTNSSPTF